MIVPTLMEQISNMPDEDLFLASDQDLMELGKGFLKHGKSDCLPAFTVNYLEMVEGMTQNLKGLGNPFAMADTSHGWNPNSKRGVFKQMAGGFMNRRKQTRAQS